MFWLRDILDQKTEKYSGCKQSKVRTCYYYIKFFYVGNTTATYFLFRQLCESHKKKKKKKKKLNVDTFSAAHATMAKIRCCRCSAKQTFLKIVQKLIDISVMKCSFNNVKAYNFVKKILQHQCFTVNFVKFLGKTTVSMRVVF